jgi:dethiobiotin synthetase
MLPRAHLPGLFITGTDTGVGKTLVAAGIGDWFRRQGRRVGVLKPVATGCEHRREGLVSEDAEFLAHHADARHPLDLICPERYTEPLAPAVAARRAGRPLDWENVGRALRIVQEGSDVLIVEGAGGVMVPLDEKYLIRDVAVWLGLPVVVVARPSLGTINHTLLSIDALRHAGAKVAGVVINRYPTDTPGTAEETSPREIERWGKVPILSVVPETKRPMIPHLPGDISAAMDLVDWARFARG